MSSYYQHHVFFCTNLRDASATRPSCQQCDASAMLDHAKKRIKALDMAAPGKVRINKAGCLERCEEGPVLVIYPEATWYTYLDTDDIDEIIDSHLIGGQPVERLLL